MARPKKQAKAKEPVRIRFKELSNGNKSVYLDIYRDGKRKYEFLKLYIVPETSQTAKMQNEQTLAAANAIKAQRIIEISNNQAGIKNNSPMAKISLGEYAAIVVERKAKKVTENTLIVYRRFLRMLAAYGDKIAVRNIDKKFCLDFLTYLRETHYDLHLANVKTNPRIKRLNESSVTTYFAKLNSILNEAVKEGIIPVNPSISLETDERPHELESKRTFLTVEEVKALINTPAISEYLRNLFLFCCFCGLRWSDAIKLTWGEIESNNGQYFINLVMKKTKTALYLPISAKAQTFMPSKPEGAKDTDRVFKQTDRGYINKKLKQWAKAAGINKNISFHVSRHTFATTALTLGADLYTVSKLLGHSEITTTQVYAKIVNSKKAEAVNLFDKAFE